MYDVVVIGAGLAGCSAALHLVRRGHSVLLVEKKQYPTHKLCGEFLSPEVNKAFRELGVLGPVHAAGARPMEQALLTTAGGSSFQCALPGEALGLSRYRLDHLLLRRAVEAGAESRLGTAVRGVQGTLHDGFRVEMRARTVRARIVLGAYGKRGLLDRKLNRRFIRENVPRVAFKAHYRGLDMDRRIELHAFPGGYCGLSPVEEGRVNVCWIADERSLQEAGSKPEDMIQSTLSQNPMLARRLAHMERCSSRFEAISQISLSRKSAFEGDVCMLGDAAAMIAPLCGDGMAMALRSSALAAPLTSAFLRGELDRDAFKRRYRSEWEAEFAGRLRLGRWIHHLVCRPWLADMGVAACRFLPGLGPWLVQATRG